MSIKKLLSFALILIFSGSASGHKQKSSLSFVIDVTSSMKPVITEVKNTVDNVFNKCINSNASHIENFVLVTFDDPHSRVLTVTSDRHEFMKYLDGITTITGYGCPEASMEGILKGLEASNPNSFLYVFTDASAHDFKKVDIVQSLSQKKSIQINFLLTGACLGYSKKLYLVYEQLTQATSGQIFNISSDDVSKIINYVATTLQFKKTILARKEMTSATIEDVQFTIDSKTWNVFISVGSPHPDFTIVDSEGNEVEIEIQVTTKSNTIVRLKHENVGTYTIKLKNHEKTLVSVSGATSICFQHGFSSVLPTSLDETEIRPIGDVKVKNYLAILLDNSKKDVLLDTVDLINENDMVLKTLDLKLIYEKEQFYVTESFEVPSTMFRIAINGQTTTKEKIKRVSITTTQYPNPKVEGEVLEIENINKEIKVKILTENKIINVDLNGNIKLKCKVSGMPKPRISWLDDRGNELKHEVINLNSAQYISVLDTGKIDKDLKLTCKAENTNDINEEIVVIKIIKKKGILDPEEDPREAPKIDKKNKRYEVQKGTRVRVNCSIIAGKPRPQISWSHNGSSIDATEEILRLNNVNTETSGTYKCVAHNEAGEDQFEIEVIVIYAPVIKSISPRKPLNVPDGEKVILPCSVEGLPSPSVNWFFDKTKIYSSGTYTIFHNNSLSFKGSKSLHVYGKYTCEAKNKINTAKLQYDVRYCEVVTIDPPESSNMNVTLGGTLDLLCNAHGIPEPTIEWIKIGSQSFGKTMTEHIGSNSKVYQINRAQQKDSSGEYKCYASNSCKLKKQTMSIIVNVLVKPVIKKSKLNIAVRGDRIFIIPCEVEGNPKPTVKWEFDKGSQNFKNGADNSLILENITEKSKGNYKCFAENEYGNDFYTYSVSVDDYPKQSRRSKSSKISYELGTPMSFPCMSNLPSSAEHVRWYKDGQLKYTCEKTCNYSRPISETSDSGNYVCRYLDNGIYFNNFINLDRTLTFKRILTTTTINYVANSKATLDCDAEGNILKVTWKCGVSKEIIPNMDKLIYEFNMTPDKIQTYECTVKNIVGSITRQFEIISDARCRVDLPFVREMPFFMRKNKRIVSSTVPINSDIKIICNYKDQIIGSALTIDSPITAKCQGDTIFKTKQGDIDISKLKCKTLLNFETRKMHSKCLWSESELIAIDIRTGSSSTHTIFNICINLKKRIPQFVKYNISPYMANTIPEKITNFNESKDIINLNYADIYNCKKQLDNIYSSTHVRLDKNYKNCFTQRQLVNPRDVMPGLEQLATYTYLNVVPVWSTYSNGNWDEVENRIRSLTKSLNVSLEVWAGASKKMNLPGQVTEDPVVINDRYEIFLRIPRYVWKVVIHRDEKKGLAIILVNIPNLDLAVEDHNIKNMGCDKVCEKTKWMNNIEWRNIKKGLVFCCSIKQFKAKFQFENLFPSYEIFV